MDRHQRRQFLAAYWPGLSLLIFVYVALTIIRTLRDDFAVEIWRDLGTSDTPSVFAQTETLVAILVTALNALAVLFRRNRTAMRVIVALMCGAFCMVGASVWLHLMGNILPFGFMVACGVGLYVPYVAFHTTVFERLIAASRRPCNVGFLMYVADAMGYLGYSVVIVLKTVYGAPGELLTFFLWGLSTVAVLSVLALLVAMIWFERVLPDEDEEAASSSASPTAQIS